nr:hypothetical protein [Tanacetum cinerariifolium]
PARTFVASKEVKTLAISSESVLIFLAAASPSLDLLPLIGASSPDLSPITPSLSSKKSKGLSNPCSSGVLYNWGCISLGNSDNGNGSHGKRWKWD